jgi:hypothetical protein
MVLDHAPSPGRSAGHHTNIDVGVKSAPTDPQFPLQAAPENTSVALS